MFSEKLRELRDLKGEKQDQLAKVIGFKATTISQYEGGTREPDLDTLVKIAHHYGVTCDYLLDNSNTPNTHIETLVLMKNENGGHKLIDCTTDDILHSLIEKYYQMSPRSRKSLLSFADQMLLIDAEQSATKEAK